MISQCCFRSFVTSIRRSPACLHQNNYKTALSFHFSHISNGRKRREGGKDKMVWKLCHIPIPAVTSIAGPFLTRMPVFISLPSYCGILNSHRLTSVRHASVVDATTTQWYGCDTCMSSRLRSGLHYCRQWDAMTCKHEGDFGAQYVDKKELPCGGPSKNVFCKELYKRASFSTIRRTRALSVV